VRNRYFGCFFAVLSHFGMNPVKAQRICVKFCLKLGKTAEETHSMLRQAYGDDALSQTTI
jgi:hypothetical protein